MSEKIFVASIVRVFCGFATCGDRLGQECAPLSLVWFPGLSVGWFWRDYDLRSCQWAGIGWRCCIYCDRHFGLWENFLLAWILRGVIPDRFGLLKAGWCTHFPSAVIKGMLAAIRYYYVLKQIPHMHWYEQILKDEISSARWKIHLTICNFPSVTTISLKRFHYPWFLLFDLILG